MVHMDYRPCGQCMNCRINNKRKWTARILLESLFHTQSIFITLTYNELQVPLNEHGEATLKPEDLKKFLYRLRKAYSGTNAKFRFFAVGEYGNKTWRPHYHAILFGVGLEAEALIAQKWSIKGKPIGFTSVAELTPERAAYTAQYTTKKMTGEQDHRLNGKHPEFARMSNRYGIGEPACAWLARTMSTKGGLIELEKYGDVWNSVRIDGKIWPIAPYLRMKIRDRLGIPQDSRERAIHFDHIDYDTGELKPNLPLPEHYGPWQDCRDQRFPANIKHGETETLKALLPNLLKAEKRTRLGKKYDINKIAI